MTVLVLMGVSGCGKSTVAGLLAGRLGWDFCEGDDLHPAENVAKMAAGIPLTDDDRLPWLRRIAAWIDAERRAGRPGVVTCSALKHRYRDVLRGPGVVFVLLDGSKDLIATRMRARHEHFMPVSLLDSQLADLERPDETEQALIVDIGPPPAAQAAQIIDTLGLESA